MSALFTEMFSVFATAITSFTTGIKEAFSNIIFVDPTVVDPVVSPLAIFVFVLLGLSLATGIVSGIVAMVRNRA